MKQRRPSKCIKKTSWFMLYSGIHYINSKISPKNVRYKRSTKVARARKVVERSLLSSKGPEAPVLHEGRARARARARAKYPGHFGNKPKTSPIEQISYRLEPKNSPLQRVTLQSLKSCYRWSILLRESVSNLAPASAQNQPKI